MMEKNIGKLLKVLRSFKNYSQEQIVNDLGIKISRQTLSDYETNHVYPKFHIVEEIANICDCDIIVRDRKTGIEYTTTNVKRIDVPYSRD